MKAVVIDAEMMGNLMEHGASDLVTKLIGGEPELGMRSAEDDDAIWSDSVVVDSSIGERHSFVDTEQALTVGVLLACRPILDDDVEVVDLLDHPLGQRVERFVDDLLKALAIHAPRLGHPIATLPPRAGA